MKENNFSFEEFPLYNTTLYQNTRKQSLKGPIRVLKLCILGIITPALFLSVPLYMRYRVYGYQMYPLAMSDMRLLDSKVSTTWCQRQLVKVNATFNAFLLPNSPKLSRERKTLSMVRELTLEDDMKEYWGFYLLRGSSVTVSTCVRWPGASLIVIRGHKHLHECAYIGDDSSEELEEMMKAIREGNETEDSPANQPKLMKRHRPDIKFHSPLHSETSENHTLNEFVDNSEITDPKTLKDLLKILKEKSKAPKMKPVPKLQQSHVHRNSTIAKGESPNLKIIPPENDTNSEEVLREILGKLNDLGEKGSTILQKVNQRYNSSSRSNHHDNIVLDTKGRHYSKPVVKYEDDIDRARRRKRDLILTTALGKNLDDEDNDKGIEEDFKPDGIADHKGTINETTLNDMSNSEFWSSFSSSEEALLNCAGLILNLPLTPHRQCQAHLNEKESYLDNTITYKIPTSGYYFFVFNSENEIQPNFIRVQFDLDKAVYNVSHSVANCKNSSETCGLPLDFFSSEKLVMELPVTKNNTLWNEEFIVISECEPRTAIYIFCMIMVPVLVTLFAFS